MHGYMYFYTQSHMPIKCLFTYTEISIGRLIQNSDYCPARWQHLTTLKNYSGLDLISAWIGDHQK